MKFLSILTKIVGVWVVITGFWLLHPQLVFAEDINANVTYSLNMNLDSNFAATITLQANISNLGENLVDSFNLTIPFKHAVLKSTTFNGVALQEVTVNGDEYPQITANFGEQALRMGKAGVLTFQLTTPKLATTKSGINTIYIPKIESNYQLKEVDYHISLDPNLPQMIFASDASSSDNPNQLIFSNTQAVLLQWAGSLVWDLSDTILSSGLNADSKSAVNLVPQISGQTTDYVSILDYPLFAQDKLANLWLIDDMSKNDYKFDYSVRVTKTVTDPKTFDTVRLDSFQIPLHESIDGDNYVKFKSIYKYVVENFPLNTELINKSPADLADLNTKISAKTELTPFEESIVLARFLQQANIPARVVYGFVFVPGLNNFDSSVAHVWVEAKVDDVVYSVDPALAKDINVDGIDTQGLNRLVMGVWDPANTFDSALGLLNNSPKSELTVTTLDATDAPHDFELTGNFPTTAYSGEYYAGKITLTNKSNEFLSVKSITLNGEEIPLTAIQLSSDLTRLVPPYGQVEIKLDYLKLGNLFYDGDFAKDLTVNLTNTDFKPQTISFKIKFIPNLGLMLAIIIAGLVLAIGLLVFLLRHKFILWFRAKRKWKNSLV